MDASASIQFRLEPPEVVSGNWLDHLSESVAEAVGALEELARAAQGQECTAEWVEQKESQTMNAQPITGSKPVEIPAIHGAESLTTRERRVVCLAWQAWSNKEISAEMGISSTTVSFHLHQALKKLGLRNRVDLALWVERSLTGVAQCVQ